MRSKFSLKARCLGLLLSMTSLGAYSQEDSPEGSVAPLSEVEDSTLDGAGSVSSNSTDPVSSSASAPEPEIKKESVTENQGVEAEPPAASASEEQSTDSAPASQGETEVPKTPVAEISEPGKKGDDSANEPAKIDSSAIKGIYGGRVFGQYRIQLAGNKPSFNEGQKCYEKFYGNPETYLTVTGDWFPMDWWINPGVTFRMGTYSVKGKAVKGAQQGSSEIDCDSLSVANKSKTTLLFLPIQLGAKVEMTPFSRKWIVLDAWFAGEYGWWQETRDNTTSSSRPISMATDDRVYTNTGRKYGTSMGGSVHLLLNALEERTVRSMIDTMGIGYVYLTGFYEKVTTQSKTGLTFGRNVMGIGFTFEAYK